MVYHHLMKEHRKHLMKQTELILSKDGDSLVMFGALTTAKMAFVAMCCMGQNSLFCTRCTNLQMSFPFPFSLSVHFHFTPSKDPRIGLLENFTGNLLL